MAKHFKVSLHLCGKCYKEESDYLFKIVTCAEKSNTPFTCSKCDKNFMK